MYFDEDGTFAEILIFGFSIGIKQVVEMLLVAIGIAIIANVEKKYHYIEDDFDWLMVDMANLVEPHIDEISDSDPYARPN